MDRQVVPVQLSGGGMIFAEVRSEGEPLAADALLSFDGVKKIIEELGTDLVDALRTVAPDKATVEIDLDLTAKPGFLTAVLVNAKGEATIKLTLEWDKASAPTA